MAVIISSCARAAMLRTKSQCKESNQGDPVIRHNVTWKLKEGAAGASREARECVDYKT
jgi:hypothetical protein